jgi:5-methyltetrahydropteroyltriglutamate--homocysteine methyltransferase
LGIAAAFRRERAIDPQIEKVTLPGPSEITMRIEPEEDRRATWPTIIELIRTEIQACIDVGATDIQLDLPHIAMGLVDGEEGWTPENTAAMIQAIFAGFRGIRRSIHFCYGDFMAQSWTENRTFHPLLPTIQALDGTVDRLVLEFSLPEQWAERALLAQIPTNMEVAAGIIDVKSPIIESIDEVVAKIHELLRYVPAERLLICPSCGLGRRKPELAIAKAQVMTQAVQHVNKARAAL